jgi:hypothetical protein
VLHLDRRLADTSGRPRTVGLRNSRCRQSIVWRQGVHRPCGVTSGAPRAFHRYERVGEKMLDGLKRSDGDAVLPARLCIFGGKVDGAAHGSDEVSAGH